LISDDLPQKSSPPAFKKIIQHVERSQNILNDIYTQVMGNLALNVEESEKTIGLEPIVMGIEDNEE
jgi:hypothetical protein